MSGSANRRGKKDTRWMLTSERAIWSRDKRNVFLEKLSAKRIIGLVKEIYNLSGRLPGFYSIEMPDLDESTRDLLMVSDHGGCS